MITPTALAYGGDGIGRLPDGRAVFVPFVLPGERVRVRIIEEKRGHARAELVEILQPAPERVQPRCPHFITCGGCHYQHMPYALQLQAKTDILVDQLQRIGGLTEVPVQPAIPSPQPYNYRNHIQFHLDRQGKLGFQAMRTNAVVPIRECHLPEESLNWIWPQLDIEPGAGQERVSLRSGAGDEVQIILESDQAEPVDFSVEELPVSVVHLGPGGSLVLAGSEHLEMEVLGQTFRVSAGAFFQVNTPMAEAMVKHLLESLPFSGGTTVLDVYCGVGLFSAFIAPRVNRLVGIEVSEVACSDFAVNLDRFDHVELYQAQADEVLSNLKFQPDIIIVDPPRSGLERGAMDGLLAQGATWLGYVSCDPATLARDARKLIQGGYRLEKITPFDLFSQTYHIESISLFTKI